MNTVPGPYPQILGQACFTSSYVRPKVSYLILIAGLQVLMGDLKPAIENHEVLYQVVQVSILSNVFSFAADAGTK